MMNETTVFLSLGSNLGDREGNLCAALRGLGPDVQIRRVSSLYETVPIGVIDQPAFLNLAAMGETTLAPDDLLAHVKAIERQVGRRETYRWGPRVVDLDIIFYGDSVMETEALTIPHRETARRAFVLLPLCEIAPDHVHPGLGRTVQDLAGAVSGEGVRRAGVS
jgi:2-amino-4-hydroxy-6-hydroxymethyldihydropteridine diphosphokinase